MPVIQANDTSTCVRVELGPRSYEIRIVTGRGEEVGGFVRASLDVVPVGRSCRRAVVITDQNVEMVAEPTVASLRSAGFDLTTIVIPAGESSKCLARASAIYDQLIDLKVDRHAVVIAVGGGVVGDLAGFVAATYARGLPLFMIPTSLLAQVDSSVGGKVGVNHPQAKNIIGAFHQPVGVWIDTQFLAALPKREFRCGMAEVVKYGVILDADFFGLLESQARSILALDPLVLRTIITRSCELKAQVVSQDEREETDRRAILNFGHTIGHAIEAVAGFDGPYRHGEAVAVGMVAACRLAERIGWIRPDLTGRLVALLEQVGLPTAAAGLDAEALLDAMNRDKKKRLDRIRFVLPRAVGHVELTDAVTTSDIKAILE